MGEPSQGVGVTVHTFSKDLHASHKWADAPWWRTVYETRFPGCQIQDMREDGWWQRAGIDRLIHLPNATSVRIEEKVRDKAYDDFALEFEHVHKNSRQFMRLGWMNLDLACDYLAYAVVPRRVCYMLPWRELRQAWHRNKAEWIDNAESSRHDFRIAEANNENRYISRSVVVPATVLRDALTSVMSVQWTDGWDAA